MSSKPEAAASAEPLRAPSPEPPNLTSRKPETQNPKPLKPMPILTVKTTDSERSNLESFIDSAFKSGAEGRDADLRSLKASLLSFYHQGVTLAAELGRKAAEAEPWA